jgi:endonuclease/exonuclease/phosphatase (EEP) superfamily protein YafD
MRTLSAILAAIALLVGAVVVAQLVLQARTGPLPLVSVLETHLLAAAAVMAIVGLLGTLPRRREPAAARNGRARALLRLGLLGVLVLAVVRDGGELWSPEPDVATDGRELVVMSWNLELGSKAAAVSVGGIADVDADVVALQELTPAVADAIEADPRLTSRYPYRILEPRDGVDGMGLLARLPLFVRGSDTGPLQLRAGLLLEDGTIVDLLDVHPYPPRVALLGPLPVGLDTRSRDEAIGTIASRVAALDDPALALVAGDLNASPAEPGLEPLETSLADAHAVAGTGAGFTWRPSRLEGLGLGVLRIDHVLAGARLRPVATSVDCSLPGDHCRLIVTLRVLDVAAGPAAG